MIQLWFIPIVSALIGWFTNFLAVKMLFYPREEKRFLFFRFQGVFPKRQNEMARRQAKLVAEELFSGKELMIEMQAQLPMDKLAYMLNREISQILERKVAELPIYVQPFAGKRTQEKVQQLIFKEMEPVLPRVTEEFLQEVGKLDIEELVYQKVKGFSSEKLEQMLLSVLQKELKYIELVGAVLGFVIGLVQVLIIGSNLD